MGGNTFQVYRSDEKRGYSPRIVRQSVSEINNRSQKNGFNVVVFPEREQTARPEQNCHGTFGEHRTSFKLCGWL